MVFFAEFFLHMFLVGGILYIFVKAIPLFFYAIAYSIGIVLIFVWMVLISLANTFPILFSKWWAWLVQIPIFFLQIIFIIGGIKGNSVELLGMVVLLQIISSIIIFNLQRIVK